MAVTATETYTVEELSDRGLQSDQLPRHVAIIMDGNGRWARSRGFPRIEGHRRGVRTVRLIIEESARIGLKQLTLYCFSSENWKRPPRELNMLMHLLRQYVIEERSEIMRQGLRFCTIGRRDGLSDEVLKEIDKTVECSRNNSGMRLCLALNYGSRHEILDAVQRISCRVQAGELDPNKITEQTIADSLDTAGMVDPDLMIRTAGEMRISNFLLWQLSYAEFWVTDKYWPDFRESDLAAALQDFAQRDRRYGGLSTRSES